MRLLIGIDEHEGGRDAQELAGIEVETHAYGGGSPAGILTTPAEGEGFDAIVVGSPRRGAIGEARCPVLVASRR